MDDVGEAYDISRLSISLADLLERDFHFQNLAAEALL